MLKSEVNLIIRNFPIGGFPKDKGDLLSKAEVIAYLARVQEQFSMIENYDDRELIVRDFFSDKLGLSKEEKLPNIGEAIERLKISNGFLQDYNKVQYIKENNSSFDRAYDYIAYSLGLELKNVKKR